VGSAILRGLVLGLALAVAFPTSLLILFLILGSVGKDGPGLAKALAGAAGAALVGLCCGLAVTPMALIESLAARASRRSVHLVAAASTLPVGLLVLVVLFIQGTYAVTMVESGDFAHAGNSALELAREVPKAGARSVLTACIFLVSVPLTTYFRLRGYTRLQQLWRVVLGTAVLGTAFGVLAISSISYGTIWTHAPRVVMPTGVSMIIGALLPGAYMRGDQLEAWALRKLEASRE
jgi:hypothetical protein